MADKYRNQEEARCQPAKGSFQAKDIKPTGISKGETRLHHSSPGGESTACGKCGAQIEELEKTLNDIKIQLENMEEKKDDEERKRIKENTSLRNEIAEKDKEIKKRKKENLAHWKEKEGSLEEKEKRLRKTREEHASVLKDKETELYSLKTEMRKLKEEHASVLKEKGDEINSLETKMRRQKKEHDSIVKQKEDKIDSLGTKMRIHQKECELKLKEREDDITAVEAKLSENEDTISQLNNFIKEQGSSIATLNSQISDKASKIQDTEKRIRELEIQSKRFETVAEAIKSNSASRIASMELEQVKALERARQVYRRKWEEMEIYHSQELMKRETNATATFEEHQREIDTLRKEKKAAEEKYIKEVVKLKKEVEMISKKKSELESEQQKRKGTNRELERENMDYSNSLRIAGETNRHLSEQIESQTKINSATIKSYNISKAVAKPLKQAKDSLEQYLEQREEMYSKEIENLNAEIRRLTLRLSKIASAKMTTGNSSIADLSDVFRPTKISELFSEIYDNQWTDAFDQLMEDSDREERDAIILLLEIVQESYKTCVSTAQSHLQGVKDAMCNFRIQATQEPVSQENNVSKVDLEVPDEPWKMIMDFHKAAAYGSKGEIAMIISSSQMESRGIRNMDKVGDYMQACAEICWLMAVRDPPVVVDVLLDVPPGCQRSFNKDRYRAYTNTGKFCDFTVWPALLLQKDGPILCKGVAQGK